MYINFYNKRSRNIIKATNTFVDPGYISINKKCFICEEVKLVKKKVIGILICFMLVATTVLIIPRNFNVKAADGGNKNGDEEGATLEYQYIWNKTYDLSQVIFNAPLTHDMQKGRAFGSKGEWYAKELIVDWMENEIGLWNVTTEPIEEFPHDLIDNKLEIINRGIKIDETDEIECYISPQWTNTTIGDVIKTLKDIWPYDNEDLNISLNYTNLKVYRKPFAYWFHNVFTNGLIRQMMFNTSLHNQSNMLEFIVTQIENYYGFSFDEVNETNAPYLIPWYNDTVGRFIHDFVFIDENPGFNPDKFPGLRYYITPPYFPGADLVTYVKQFIQKRIWAYNHHCKGLVLYDHNDDTYDMTLQLYLPLPILYINKSKGKPIYESAGKHVPADSTISFWLEQEINISIHSYNVIGQINGTDPSKTIILCSLYDCWWNQGTADSAIGMSIVLAIAKYMKELCDQGIKPKYTVKFIAFGGEEAGFNGAYSYEARHSDEDIVAVLDLNQLGFTQPDPALTFNIFTNDLDDLPIHFLKKSRAELIAEESNYVERTNGAKVLTPRCVRNIIGTYVGAPSNDRPFASKRTDDGIKTFCFLKDKGKNPKHRWLLHHRSGLDHTAGDVLDYYNWTG